MSIGEACISFQGEMQMHVLAAEVLVWYKSGVLDVCYKEGNNLLS